ncbi:hypothetical protein DO021_20430 [Desulfobacter hydrogenophilus]|uniref:Uncharacterized protein n=1 Tax=Desulfobacter hydrogenophilus TaxID=2291 RepID=A0A328F7K9_9BACT|nr:hypothetical protein [Desulfobacter hydrogenophilus]NDY74242.1 hypothetical protein [Desulfobacter hydrogenophilus]QBH14555.1 hypothetical protein EYB58_17460 [Desulfobacter hydrogenophilus]RAM00186.1 hypothetical protein DO021_20430 [Desulfobacter hydrogenophilus]
MEESSLKPPPLNEAAGKLSPRQLTNTELTDTFATIPRVPAKIGPLTLIVQVDPSRGQTVVTAVISKTTIDKQLLTYSNSIMRLDVAIRQARATGEIFLNLQPSPRFSALRADIVASDASGKYPYKGQLASWAAKGEPVVGDYLLPLTSELSTLTTVRSVTADIADFSFLLGGRLLASMTATQLAPVQKWPNKIKAGDVVIEAGTQISLNIPTALEKGFLFLTAEFSTQTTPRTPIGSSVANWSLPHATVQR